MSARRLTVFDDPRRDLRLRVLPCPAGDQFFELAPVLGLAG
jgi:hypothetical protein